MIAPLRYIISLKKRSKITVLAIAIVIMFITATSIIVYSFEISNKELVEKFQSHYYIAYSNQNLLKSKVPIYKNLHGAYVYIIPAQVNGNSTYLIGIYDPYNILGSAYQCKYDDIILGKSFTNLKYGEKIQISIFSKPYTLRITTIRKLEFFPDYWGIINYSLAQNFMKNPNFIIIQKNMQLPGLITSSMIELSEFYFKSSEEITTDLLFLAMISIVAIYFFINSLLMIEVRESIKKIAILRAIGSTTHNINAIYMLRGIYIGVSGMVVGISIGIILAYLVAAIFPLFGMASYFIIYIPPQIFLFPLLIVISGAVIGVIQPLRRANKIVIIKGLRGVLQ